MPTAIRITIEGRGLDGELDDSPTARALARRLPLKVKMSRWGDEYYGTVGGLGAKQAPDAREEMAVGELAYWPPGDALCIFFGPTPVSAGDEPRAASPVNPVGRLAGDVAVLKTLGRSVTAEVEAKDLMARGAGKGK